MNYEIQNNKIFVLVKEFKPKDIFECGQVFCYKKIDEFYFVYPQDKLAVIYEENGKYVIECLNGSPQYFINFFDLETNYEKIIKNIKKLNKKQFNLELINKSLTFGNGIRILKQEFIETLISFIFSANNNIKRFTNSLNLLREKIGEEIKIENKLENKKINKIINENKFYTFPSLNNLKNLAEKFFVEIGAGYRASYLKETISEIDLETYDKLNKFSTEELLKELIKFKGVGRKVAECVILFSFKRFDVFPVDTWIRKVYFDLFEDKNEKISSQNISKKLINYFGMLSGFIQQYLFYFKRELN